LCVREGEGKHALFMHCDGKEEKGEKDGGPLPPTERGDNQTFQREVGKKEKGREMTFGDAGTG